MTASIIRTAVRFTATRRSTTDIGTATTRVATTRRITIGTIRHGRADSSRPIMATIAVTVRKRNISGCTATDSEAATAKAIGTTTTTGGTGQGAATRASGFRGRFDKGFEG